MPQRQTCSINPSKYNLERGICEITLKMTKSKHKMFVLHLFSPPSLYASLSFPKSVSGSLHVSLTVLLSTYISLTLSVHGSPPVSTSLWFFSSASLSFCIPPSICLTTGFPPLTHPFAPPPLSPAV